MLTQQKLLQNPGLGYIENNPMPITKIQGFLEEFPWVRDYVKGVVLHTYVTRMEPEFLRLSPSINEIDEFFAKQEIEEIIFLDEKGQEITIESEKRRKKYFFFGPMGIKVETISARVNLNSSVNSVIKKLKKEEVDRIRLVLSYYSYTKTVILFKLPKNVKTIREWITKEIETERKNFEEIVNSI